MPRKTVEGYVTLTLVFAQEGDQWSAVCKELGTAACGDTLEEAQEAIREVLPLHLNGLEELGERKAFFEKHGIKFVRTRPRRCRISDQRLPVGSFLTCVTEPIRRSVKGHGAARLGTPVLT